MAAAPNPMLWIEWNRTKSSSPSSNSMRTPVSGANTYAIAAATFGSRSVPPAAGPVIESLGCAPRPADPAFCPAVRCPAWPDRCPGLCPPVWPALCPPVDCPPVDWPPADCPPVD
ncbi:hypothetical protein ACFQL4_20700 [Halosimplex aquaticum]